MIVDNGYVAKEREREMARPRETQVEIPFS